MLLDIYYWLRPALYKHTTSQMFFFVNAEVAQQIEAYSWREDQSKAEAAERLRELENVEADIRELEEKQTEEGERGSEHKKNWYLRLRSLLLKERRKRKVGSMALSIRSYLCEIHFFLFSGFSEPAFDFEGRFV